MPLMKKKHNDNYEPFMMGLLGYKGTGVAEKVGRLEVAITYLWPKLKSGLTTEAVVAKAYGSLVLAHAVQRQNHKALVAYTLDLIQKRFSNQISDWFVDAVLLNGELLRNLPAHVLRLLKWTWINECFKQGLNTNQIVALSTNNLSFAKLLALPEATSDALLRLARAVFDGNRGDRLAIKATSIFDWLNGQASPIDPMRFASDIFLFTDDGNTIMRSTGVIHRDTILRPDSTISFTINFEFVQSGWTHQRVDGGPDLRYKDNPPVGDYRQRGFALLIDERAIHCEQDPSELVARLQKWKLYWGKLMQSSRSDKQGSSTFQLNRPQVLGVATCGRCRTSQTFVLGSVGVPV